MSFTNDKETDNYATDKMGWEIIKDYIPHDKKIWSPFYCDGIIIDNPPFSKWFDICKRLKEIDKPFILVAFPKCFLTKKFQNLFKEHLQIIIPNKRPTFTHLTNPKKGYTPPFGVWYFCYKMNLEKDLIFI